MKKFLCSLLAFVLSFLLIIPPGAEIKAKAPGSAPAKLEKVTYKLKKGVLELPSNITSKYEKYKSSITLDKSTENFKPNVGQIYVDVNNKTSLRIKAFETDSNGSKIIKTETPKLTDVLEEFNIPLQTLKLTAGNVKALRKGVTFSSKPIAITAPTASTDNKFYRTVAGNGETHRFEMQDLMLIDERDSSGNYLQLKVNGFIEYQLPALTVQGSLTDFQISLEGYERSELNAHLEGKLKKNQDFWIGGYSVPYGIGSADVGIYLHFNVDGEITVDIRVEQGVSFDTGISGKLDLDWDFWNSSYDFNSYFNSDHYFNYSGSIQGKLKATVGVAAKCGLTAFGINLASLRAEFGIKGDASINNTNVDVAINAFLDINGNVVGYDYSIYYYEWLIYESHEAYTAGYGIRLNEIDANSNKISGTASQNGSPYRGKVSITVKRGGNILLDNYKLQCTSDGKFTYTYPNLHPNDIVTARIDIASPVVSTGEYKATVPFNEINITNADAFNDRIKGSVSGYYSGPITIIVESPSLPSTSANTTQNPKSRLTSYQVTCTNGQFQCNTPLTGSDKVYAHFDFEGLSVVSDKIAPNLDLKINLAVDTNGVRGTIQNMGGITPYTGKVTILYKSFPSMKQIAAGETNAVAYTDTVARRLPTFSGNINPNSIPNLTRLGDIFHARYSAIGRFGSSHFEFDKLKAPQSVTGTWTAYARIDYEGATVQGTFTINPLTLTTPNIDVNPFIFDFDRELFMDKQIRILP